MPTYTQIGSAITVGSGGASSIDFTSIPSTYTDLVLKVSVRNSGTPDQVIMKVNGSSASLSNRLLYGSGSAAASTSLTTGYIGTSVDNTKTASTFNNMEIYISNYAGSSNKSASADSVMENNATTAFAVLNAWLWSNTAAITSISLTPDSGNFVQYSTAYLYGVSNA